MIAGHMSGNSTSRYQIKFIFHFLTIIVSWGSRNCSAKNSILTIDNNNLWLEIDVASKSLLCAPPSGRGNVSEPPDYLQNQHLWLKLLAAKLQVVCVCQIFRPAS